MPGLLRGVARTAVVAGTAQHVSNNVSRRQSERWAEQGKAAPAYMSAQPQGQPQYAEPAPVAAAPAPADPIEQLKELAELKNQGILTEEEFAAQKAKILAG
jgi:hypothetical protein